MKTKEKKLAQIDALIANLGLTRKEVIIFLSKKGNISSEEILSALKEEVFEYVKNFFEKECSYPNYDVKLNSNLISLSVDSLDFVDLIVQLERQYSITIEESVAEKCATIEDIVETVCRLINERSKQF